MKTDFPQKRTASIFRAQQLFLDWYIFYADVYDALPYAVLFEELQRNCEITFRYNNG